MINVNAPFVIALAAIIFLAVMKWLEWVLMKDGSSSKQQTPAINKIEAAVKKDTWLSVFGRKLKALLFFGEADLKRPWYNGVPFGVIVFANSLAGSFFNLPRWLGVVLFIGIGIPFASSFSIFTILRANRNFFSIEDRKNRYIKTQIAQLCLTLFVMAVIIGGMMLNVRQNETDSADLKASVDWVIEPIYDAEWPEFTEGLAPVGYRGKKGLIDKEGNFVIKLQYNKADNFHEGLAAVQKDWRWGFIDRKGNVVIPFQYGEAFSFDGGIAPVKKDGKWIVIDKTGAVRFKTDYEKIYPFQEGVARVETRHEKNKNGIANNLIDTEGDLLFKKDYNLDGNFSEGCIFVYDMELGKGYFLDRNEKKTIQQNFMAASDFNGGVSAVWLEDGEYALIDHAGTVIRKLSEEEYNGYLLCREGLVIINNGKWDDSLGGSGDLRYGFGDIYGNTLIPAVFSDVTGPSDGLIGLEVNGCWGFIENPLPAPARGIDHELWKNDRTEVATVEGIPIYAGELESRAYDLKERSPALTGIPSYEKAFEQIKEKAREKYGKSIAPELIRYQIGDTYYKNLLLPEAAANHSAL
jgi:hypothetical protein